MFHQQFLRLKSLATSITNNEQVLVVGWRMTAQDMLPRDKKSPLDCVKSSLVSDGDLLDAMEFAPTRTEAGSAQVGSVETALEIWTSELELYLLQSFQDLSLSDFRRLFFDFGFIVMYVLGKLSLAAAKRIVLRILQNNTG